MPEASLESLKLLPGWHLLQTFNHTSKPASVKGFIQASSACLPHRSLQADFHKCIFFTPDSICSHRHLIHQALHFCEQTFSPQGMLPFDTKRLWSAKNPSSHSQQGRWRHDSVMPAPPGTESHGTCSHPARAGWGTCLPPGSPSAEASCESHRPGRMEPFGEATGNIFSSGTTSVGEPQVSEDFGKRCGEPSSLC